MFLNFPDAQIFTVEYGRDPRTIVAHGGWALSRKLKCEIYSELSKA